MARKRKVGNRRTEDVSFSCPTEKGKKFQKFLSVTHVIFIYFVAD